MMSSIELYPSHVSTNAMEVKTSPRMRNARTVRVRLQPEPLNSWPTGSENVAVQLLST